MAAGASLVATAVFNVGMPVILSSYGSFRKQIQLQQIQQALLNDGERRAICGKSGLL
jgi:hypothetical protein